MDRFYLWLMLSLTGMATSVVEAQTPGAGASTAAPRPPYQIPPGLLVPNVPGAVSASIHPYQIPPGLLVSASPGIARGPGAFVVPPQLVIHEVRPQQLPPGVIVRPRSPQDPSPLFNIPPGLIHVIPPPGG